VLISRRQLGAALPLLAAMLVVSGPVHAQFSASYKFLEAVRKKDGTVVNDMLNEPGSTVVNTRDITTGETALHIVTARRDITWMNFIAAKGANVNVKDGHGVTPLVLAANIGFSEGVELLISRGARLDESNSAGETPLISAVHRKDIAMMRMLLKAGADPDRADNSGRSARDYAALGGKGNGVLAEIETSAKPRSARTSPQRSYGPAM
jgi:uncharacterized protein